MRAPGRLTPEVAITASGSENSTASSHGPLARRAGRRHG